MVKVVTEAAARNSSIKEEIPLILPRKNLNSVKSYKRCWHRSHRNQTYGISPDGVTIQGPKQELCGVKGQIPGNLR